MRTICIQRPYIHPSTEKCDTQDVVVLEIELLRVDEWRMRVYNTTTWNIANNGNSLSNSPYINQGVGMLGAAVNAFWAAHHTAVDLDGFEFWWEYPATIGPDVFTFPQDMEPTAEMEELVAHMVSPAMSSRDQNAATSMRQLGVSMDETRGALDEFAKAMLGYMTPTPNPPSENITIDEVNQAIRRSEGINRQRQHFVVPEPRIPRIWLQGERPITGGLTWMGLTPTIGDSGDIGPTGDVPVTLEPEVEPPPEEEPDEGPPPDRPDVWDMLEV